MRGLRTFPARLALVVAAAFVLRVVYVVVAAGDQVVMGDALYFHDLANLLASGDGFVRPFEFLSTGVREATAEHPPLYSLYLAAFSKFGLTSFAAHRIASCLLGAATVAVVGLLARRVGGVRAGLLAAVIAAVYPSLWVIDGTLMSESLYALLIATALLAALRLQERPTTAKAVALGATVALAALTRNEALLLTVVLVLPVIALLRRPVRTRLALLGAAALACVLVLAPWVAHTVRALDRPVLITTGSGNLLSGANCDRTHRGPDAGLWRLDCVADAQDRAGVAGDRNEATRAEALASEGLAYIGDHLGRYPAVLGIRLLRVWELYDPAQSARYEQLEGRNPRATTAGIVMYYGLAALAGVGAWRLRRARRGAAAGVGVVLLAPVVLVCATALVGYGLTRFRCAAEVTLVVLAAIGIAGVRDAHGRPATSGSVKEPPPAVASAR